MTGMKTTAFRHGSVRPKVLDRSRKGKALDGVEDTMAFFMLADAMCSKRKIDCIEKVNVDVFKNKRVVSLDVSDGTRDTVETMLDPHMMEQIRASRSEYKKGKTIPWREVRARA